jgi:serine/threonine-protein kinase
MRCARCGRDLPEGAAFCTGCGAPSAGAATVAAPEIEATVPGAPASAALRAPPAAPAPGAVAGYAAAGTVVDGKYTVERVLGEGGMGVVYLAHDVHTGIPVVLKAVRSELAHREDVRERTLSEGRALARIDHPNVVRLNAVVAEGAMLWLVMQYIDGESLEAHLGRLNAAGQRMALPEVVRVFRQICLGIAAAHREGLIHRDLKPANVLLRHKDGVAKVGDFGIAKAEEDARAGRGVTKGIIGSLWYMSPEQVRGRRDLDKRVDVYALGVVLYEMLTGRVPFDAESQFEVMRLHAEAPLPLVASQRQDVPAALDAFVARATAKDREERYGSAEELLAALDAVPGLTAPSAAPLVPAAVAASPAAPAPTTTVGQALPPGGPSHAPASRAPLYAATAVVAVAMIGGSIYALRGSAGGDDETAPPRPSATASASAAPPPSSPPPPASPLAALAGRWHVPESGRDLDAVPSGDALELRVVDPAQFAPQDYRAGEARFVLRPKAGETSVFLVEDRVRPRPPVDHAFDSAQARSTCIAIATRAGDEPLEARWDGTRLNVELAKIEPTEDNFDRDGQAVIGCRGLEDLATEKVPAVLERRPARGDP